MYIQEEMHRQSHTPLELRERLRPEIGNLQSASYRCWLKALQSPPDPSIIFPAVLTMPPSSAGSETPLGSDIAIERLSEKEGSLGGKSHREILR